MERMFQNHEVRVSRTIEGTWDFTVVDEPDLSAQASQSFPYRMAVPSCWETHPDFSTYQGVGAYRTIVNIRREASVRLIFKGVSHTAHIYWDGMKVEQHYNAYTAFDVVIPDVRPGEHTLIVAADNRFSEAFALHIPNDYYTYGGIIRPVVLEELYSPYVRQLYFTPEHKSGEWSAEIRAVVSNPNDMERTVQVTGTLAGIDFSLGTVTLAPGAEKKLQKTFAFLDVSSWSPEEPSLYQLHVRLYEDKDAGNSPLDDLIERVGFRTVTTRDGKLQVNGKDVVLQGFNRHEDHPMAGAALPVSLMLHDLDLMRDMGANAVRTSHYPNDERFLDLCDELGFLVWEENHARGLSLEQMRNPNFVWQCEQVNREMVEQHYNHPSIILWAILNECASDTEEGREHYSRQLGQLRALDTSRPLTFASHHRERELCFDLADIVSFNLYPGWYTDEDPKALCEQARAWADRAGGAGKPMIMSEFGGDGYYGLRDKARMRGTEERQADIIEANLAAYTSSPFLSGMYIWQFCDCRVTDATGWLLSRAGAQNSKGIVDRYRRPKLAYDVVKRYFKGSKNVISNES